MISSTYKILNTTAPCKTFYCTIWSKFPNCLTIRQKTYKTLMKMTPFLSHWEEQRHLLVWVGLGRDRSFGDRIPIGKLMKMTHLSYLTERNSAICWCGLGWVGTGRLVIESLSGNCDWEPLGETGATWDKKMKTTFLYF
jgi:hypothetical protein